MGFLSRKKPKPAPVEIHDERQQMEEAVPERPVEPPPVFEEEPKVVAEPEPAPEEVEEPALNAQTADEEEGPARLKAVDLLAPTRLDFLKEKEAVVEEPVKTAEVIAFANQKGGVAKTTTTLNLAVAFAEEGHRVLCVAMDPQGNLTMSRAS